MEALANDNSQAPNGETQLVQRQTVTMPRTPRIRAKAFIRKNLESVQTAQHASKIRSARYFAILFFDSGKRKLFSSASIEIHRAQTAAYRYLRDTPLNRFDAKKFQAAVSRALDPDPAKRITGDSYRQLGLSKDKIIYLIITDHLATLPKQGISTSFSTVPYWKAMMEDYGALDLYQHAKPTMIKIVQAAFKRQHEFKHYTAAIARKSIGKIEPETTPNTKIRNVIRRHLDEVIAGKRSLKYYSSLQYWKKVFKRAGQAELLKDKSELNTVVKTLRSTIRSATADWNKTTPSVVSERGLKIVKELLTR